jgi:hypothetical protein
MQDQSKPLAIAIDWTVDDALDTVADRLTVDLCARIAFLVFVVALLLHRRKQDAAILCRVMSGSWLTAQLSIRHELRQAEGIELFGAMKVAGPCL